MGGYDTILRKKPWQTDVVISLKSSLYRERPIKQVTGQDLGYDPNTHEGRGENKDGEKINGFQFP